MVRRATGDDVEAIAKVFRRAYATLAFLPTLHTPEADAAHFGRLVREHEAWVWDAGALGVLGFAVLEGDVLSALYVEPVAQGRGIGSGLWERVVERRPEGFRLWVFQRSERARAFYERRGCQLVRRTDGSGNEEREPDALYAWRPPPAR